MKNYNGRRFSFKFYNCYHHVVDVRKDAGLLTPPINMPESKEQIWPEIKRVIELSAMPVDKPQNYDVAIFGGAVGHIGVYIDGLISHCNASNRCVVTDSASDYSDIQYVRPL